MDLANAADIGAFVLGVVRGAAASISFGLAPHSIPQPSDSTASLAEQMAGSVAVGVVGGIAAAGGTGEAIATSPAVATGVGAVVPGAGSRSRSQDPRPLSVGS